jgi:uncharacterized membrane protein
MAKSTTANVKHSDSELTVQQHDTDSPILPVSHLKQLQTFRPDAVDFIIEQTKIEADFRREETKRLNLFTFIEHLIGQIFALLIGLSGIVGGAYVAVIGQPAAGASIAGIALTELAVVFILGRSKKT